MGSGRVRARSSVALGKGAAGGRARARWSVTLGERFLALVAQTGNARAAAAALGAPNAFNNRMKRDGGFRARAMAAVAEADRRLSEESGAFVGARLSGRESAFAQAPRALTLPGFAPLSLSREGRGEDALGGYLKPGRKRAQSGPEPVVRRNCRGRWQVTLARDGHMTADIEADFLARLAATGNFDASARAVGFQAASLHERARKWPAFRAACDEALETAEAVLGYRLVAHAHALLRTPGEVRPEGEEEVPFDPKAAMQILGFLDARKGRTRRGPRKGVPDRSFEEAVESVLAKIEAIERHEALTAAEAARGEAAKETGE